MVEIATCCSMLSGDTFVPFGDCSVLCEVTMPEAPAQIWMHRAPPLDTLEHILDVDYWSVLDAELRDRLLTAFEVCLSPLCLDR